MNTFRKAWRHTSFVLVVVTLMMALVSPALAAADSFTVSQSFPLDLLVYVPCADGGAGEEVYLTGYLHDLFHVTFTPSGGFVISGLDNPQGISGTGLTTGDSYQGTGVTRFVTSGRLGFTDTFVNNFRIIGEGTGNNYLVHENVHITVNANGTLTAYVDNFSVECK